MINNEFDLGSEPVDEDFDPFAADEEVDTNITEETAEQPKAETPAKVSEAKEAKSETDLSEKPPVFEYAGATENIDDTSKTFDELRIEKATDFPELDDGKRVSWTVEYGKITKNVTDPKGMSIGKMKSDIEVSKEFTDSLKKAKDKNPTCKVKPRVTAQSKGTVVAATSYKGVFASMEDAVTSGKLITLFPARDGNVYEMRNNEMGRFITHSIGNSILSEAKAGFTPALPPVPFKRLLEIITLFRKIEHEGGKEALVNIYWDKQENRYFVDIPEQTASPISVDSRANPEYDNDRYIHFMDIHSHCKMSAFFSATDNRDERATRVYAVIGNVHGYFPEIKVRISNGGTYLEIDPSIVFAEYNHRKSLAKMWFSQFQYRACVISEMLSGIFNRWAGDDE